MSARSMKALRKPSPTPRGRRGRNSRWLVILSIAGLVGACRGTAAGQGGGGTLPPDEARSAPATVERRLAAMGTWLTVEVVADDRGRALAASEAAVRAIEAAEARLSTWRSDSELSAVGRARAGVAVPLGWDTANELARAFALAQATGGAFDPTIGPLVTAWDLRGAGRVPTEPELERALAHTGLERFRFGFDAGSGRPTLTKDDPRARVEEGGFGKGAGLDAAVAALARMGVRRARLDLGGQVALYGSEEPHWVELADPEQREHAVLLLELPPGSLATTGASERAVVVEGRRYHHVLDPSTGRPVPVRGSVSVWAMSALEADALSTAATVMGPARARAWAAQRPDIGWLALIPEGPRLRVLGSPWLLERTTALDPRVIVEAAFGGRAPSDMAGVAPRGAGPQKKGTSR